MPFINRLTTELVHVPAVLLLSFEDILGELSQLSGAHMAVESEVVAIRCMKDEANQRAGNADGARAMNGVSDSDSDNDGDSSSNKPKEDDLKIDLTVPGPSAADLSAMGAFNIYDVLNEAVVACAPTAARTGSAVHLQITGSDVPDIFGNEALVADMVISCLTIALERSPPHSEVSVSTATPRPGLLQIRIADAGEVIQTSQNRGALGPRHSMQARECGGSLRWEPNPSGHGMMYMFTVFAGLEGLELLEEQEREQQARLARPRTLSEDVTWKLEFEVEGADMPMRIPVNAVLMRFDLECGARIQFFVNPTLAPPKSSFSDDEPAADCNNAPQMLTGEDAYEQLITAIAKRAHSELENVRREAMMLGDELNDMMIWFGETVQQDPQKFFQLIMQIVDTYEAARRSNPLTRVSVVPNASAVSRLKAGSVKKTTVSSQSQQSNKQLTISSNLSKETGKETGKWTVTFVLSNGIVMKIENDNKEILQRKKNNEKKIAFVLECGLQIEISL